MDRRLTDCRDGMNRCRSSLTPSRASTRVWPDSPRSTVVCVSMERMASVPVGTASDEPEEDGQDKPECSKDRQVPPCVSQGASGRPRFSKVGEGSEPAAGRVPRKSRSKRTASVPGPKGGGRDKLERFAPQMCSTPVEDGQVCRLTLLEGPRSSGWRGVSAGRQATSVHFRLLFHSIFHKKIVFG